MPGSVRGAHSSWRALGPGILRASLSTADHANVPVIPPVLFGAGLAAGFLLKWLVPVPLVPPAFEPEVSFAGSMLALLGLAFGGWAFGTFLKARTTPHPNEPVSVLVTRGPYRVSRNPMYVGLLGLHGRPRAPCEYAVGPGGASAGMARAPPPRDRPRGGLFEREFGEEYRAFKARTRRWL